MLRRDAFISKLRFIAHTSNSQQTPLNKLGNQLSGGFRAVLVLHIFTYSIYHTLNLKLLLPFSYSAQTIKC